MRSHQIKEIPEAQKQKALQHFAAILTKYRILVPWNEFQIDKQESSSAESPSQLASRLLARALSYYVAINPSGNTLAIRSIIGNDERLEKIAIIYRQQSLENIRLPQQLQPGQVPHP